MSDRKYDITVLGELLIDFTDAGFSPSGMKLFERNPGGAVANVAAAAAKLGHSTAFIGKVGDDMHGRFLRDTLNGAGICTDGLIMSPDVFTTLAFVALGDSGERSFSFARKPGADTCLEPSEVNTDIIKQSSILHVGSLSLTDEPVRSATIAAVKAAKCSGALIAYDPNYRASLWPDEETASVQMRSLLPFVDMMKLSDSETVLLTGEKDCEKAAEILMKHGLKCVAVTCGADGAVIGCGGQTRHIPGFACTPVDTTGAGDCFWGAFLSAFLEDGGNIDALTADICARYARFANAAAACCVCGRGAIPSMPTRGQIAAIAAE